MHLLSDTDCMHVMFAHLVGVNVTCLVQYNATDSERDLNVMQSLSFAALSIQLHHGLTNLMPAEACRCNVATCKHGMFDRDAKAHQELGGLAGT